MLQKLLYNPPKDYDVGTITAIFSDEVTQQV